MLQLVLLDLKLPKMNSPEVLRRQRAAERTRFLPVVILVSCEEEQDAVDGYDSHVEGYIGRPVAFAQFSRNARQLKPLVTGTERTLARRHARRLNS
jgi:two-component system response regulator